MRRRILKAVHASLLAGCALMSAGEGVANPASPPQAQPKAEPRAEPKKEVDAAAVYARLGCSLCHAPGARYHDRIVKAASRPEEEVAKWIRNPEKFVPGTAMPTYASLVDEPTALALARWIKSGGPSASAKK